MGKKDIKQQEERRKEILGILIIAFSVLVLLGLISYHPSDYPNSGSPVYVKNWLGLAGAWIGYYLYVYTIGYSCLIFPLLIFLFGWNLFFQRGFKYFFRLCLYLLGMGLFLSIALAIPEAVSEEGSKYGYRLSGLLGGFLAEKLSHYLGTVGSIIVLLTSLLLLLISATAWSMRETILTFRTELTEMFQSFNKKGKSILSRNRTQRRKEVSVSLHQDEEIEKEKIRILHPRQKGIADTKEIKKNPPVIKKDVQKSLQEGIKSSDTPYSDAKAQYQFPSLDILIEPKKQGKMIDRETLERKAHFLEEKLREFDIRGSVVGIEPGPVITRFEIRPAPGVKVSRFVGAQDDLALVMQAQRVRVVAPIPGKAAVGIEIPNEEPALVTLKSILESNTFQKSASKLTLALGKTINGNPYVSDLAQMPHLLVAGATGSGKSVCLNTIIASILYRARPSEVKFILIDPKKLELSLYRKLRHHHLTTREGLNEDVVTTVDNAVAMLRSIEVEMEKRYKRLANANVRNIDDYNRAVNQGKLQHTGQEMEHKPLPFLVLVVDELADLMVSGAREVEEPISRLAQMSRAVGIHLILATQRPSVDVITGVIKANFPSRIAFQVATKADSRTILDRNGAEKLLGRGDMLFLHPREPEPIRVHGAFVSTEEVQRIVAHIHSQPRGVPWQLPGFESKRTAGRERFGERDELFNEAAKLVVRHQQGSASLLQRRLRVGYARAGRLIDELEETGIIGPFDGSKAREVLVDEEGLETLLNSDQQKSNHV